MCESRKEYEEKLNERLVSAEKTIEAYHNLRDDLKTVIVEKIRLDDPEEFACYNAEEKKVEIDKMKQDMMLKMKILGNKTYIIIFVLEWVKVHLRYFIKCIP